MGPQELEEMLQFEPFVPLRLTMSSGDHIMIDNPSTVTFLGLSIGIRDFGLQGQPRLRFISMPNIAIVEPCPRDGSETSQLEGGQR